MRGPKINLRNESNGLASFRRVLEEELFHAAAMVIEFVSEHFRDAIAMEDAGNLLG